jgi:hypothetical protein
MLAAVTPLNLAAMGIEGGVSETEALRERKPNMPPLKFDALKLYLRRSGNVSATVNVSIGLSLR